MLLAHVGHWAADLLYLLPVVVIVVVLFVQSRRDARAGRDAGARPGPDD